jgi:hypothetical protein
VKAEPSQLTGLGTTIGPALTAVDNLTVRFAAVRVTRWVSCHTRASKMGDHHRGPAAHGIDTLLDGLQVGWVHTSPIAAQVVNV